MTNQALALQFEEMESVTAPSAQDTLIVVSTAFGILLGTSTVILLT